MKLKKVVIVNVTPEGTETSTVISRHLTHRGAEKARLDYGIRNGFEVHVDGVKVWPK